MLVQQSRHIVLNSAFSVLLHTLLVAGIILLTFLPSFAFGNQMLFMREQGLSLLFMVTFFFSLFSIDKLIYADHERGTDALLQSHGVSFTTYIIGRYWGIIKSFSILFITAFFTISLSFAACEQSDLHLDKIPLLYGLGALILAHLFSLILHFFTGARFGLTLHYSLIILLGSVAFLKGLFLSQALIEFTMIFMGTCAFCALLVLISAWIPRTLFFALGILLAMGGIFCYMLPKSLQFLTLFIIDFQYYLNPENSLVYLAIFSIIQITVFLFLATHRRF